MKTRKLILEAELDANQRARIIDFLASNRVAIFIVTYEAEQHIESVLQRIPAWILPHLAEVFVIDDSSPDKTYEAATRLKDRFPVNVNVYRTPFNRGYGGNQKLGYLYCKERGHDIVILMHGDGQYAPEKIPQVLLAFDPATDAVFASRMLDKKQALHGGMPFYKWIGNQILTFIENRMLAADLSEFHTGFRAYRINSLNQIPFVYNSDGFHFDTEIIIQATAMNWRIAEIQIPTHYGDEKCHVNGIQYAINCIRSVFRYHLVNLGLFYSRNYDFNLFETENFHLKKSPYSLHQFVLRMLDKESESTSIELGAARGVLSDQIAKSTKQHCAVDARLPDLAGKSDCVAVDLNSRFAQCISYKAFDCCIALDLIEHLNDPEAFLEEVSKILRLKGKLYVSSGNISYFVMRAALLLGQFNYGKRGILDRTHKRLFNLRSLKKLLSQYGFQVTMVRGFAPPLTDMIRNNFGFRMMERVHSLFSRLWPNLFAYNFLIVASRMDRIEDILAATCSVREYYKH